MLGAMGETAIRETSQNFTWIGVAVQEF